MEGLTPEEAAETVWMLTSAERKLIFCLLRIAAGQEKKYKHWMVDTLARLLT